jgi:hypothetical protein
VLLGRLPVWPHRPEETQLCARTDGLGPHGRERSPTAPPDAAGGAPVSIKLMNAAFVLHMRPADKLCLLALADCANDEGLCYPSERTLAAKSGQSERSVRRMIKRLIAGSHVSIEARRRRQSTVYRVHPMGETGQSGHSSKAGQSGRSSAQDRPKRAGKTGQTGTQDRTELCPPNLQSESPGTSERARVADELQDRQEARSWAAGHDQLEAQQAQAAQKARTGGCPILAKLEARRGAIPALRGFRDARRGETAADYCAAQDAACVAWDTAHAAGPERFAQTQPVAGTVAAVVAKIAVRGTGQGTTVPLTGRDSQGDNSGDATNASNGRRARSGKAGRHGGGDRHGH